ncbi:MAG: hydrogenase nickel incorporation protein HypB [Acidobacteriota bacterium]
MATRILELRQGILKKNDLIAADLRQRFARDEVFVVNLVSSPGTGKTAFLESTLERLLARGVSCGALVGDLETDYDARRLARSGAPVRQINTHGRCHLEAEWIGQHLDAWTAEAGPPLHDSTEFDPATLEILFIENVGNLVCPSSYDLGEHMRAVLLSVTEGEDKPLKYPGIFNTSDVAILTKMDLAVPCEFDAAAATDNIHQVRPGMPVLETSAKTGAGLDSWVDLLLARRREPARQAPAAAVHGG